MVELLSSADPPDDVTTRRVVHTLKGNCAVMGIESIAQLLHDVESRFADCPARLSPEEAELLTERWGELGIDLRQARRTH